MVGWNCLAHNGFHVAGSCEHCDESSRQSLSWLAEAILVFVHWEEIMKKKAIFWSECVA